MPGESKPEDKKPEGEQKPEPKKPEITPEIQAMIDEALKPIKEKLDGAYSARDAALRDKAALEQKAREEEQARLRAAGKEQEAIALELADTKAKLSASEQRVVELSRDGELRSALAGHRFRSDNAREMAFRELVGTLVRDDNGVWKSKTGADIASTVKAFVEAEANSFLLTPKQNSGGGSGSPGNGGAPDSNKSLFERTQEDVLKMASEGRLRRQRK